MLLSQWTSRYREWTNITNNITIILSYNSFVLFRSLLFSSYPILRLVNYQYIQFADTTTSTIQ